MSRATQKKRQHPAVVLAMSGGVDSSLAAALLLEAGYEVFGITLHLSDLEGGCSDWAHVLRAQELAGQLGVSHRVVDYRAQFDARVLQPAWREYANARTPNPCVACNRHIKLLAAVEEANRIGAQFVASGHYAQVWVRPRGCRDSWRILSLKDVAAGVDAPLEYALGRGMDAHKDQSYFLFACQEYLPRLLFPLGQHAKSWVRREAAARAMAVHDEKESQDICWRTEQHSFAEALRRHLGARLPPGQIRGEDGRLLGRHRGIHHFTIGQRRGLGLSLPEKQYVNSIDVREHCVRVGHEASLFSSGCTARGLVVNPHLVSTRDMRCMAQIRYQHRPVASRVCFSQLDGEIGVQIEFDSPQRAVTPGQALVCYQEDRVVFGAWIADIWGSRPT